MRDLKHMDIVEPILCRGKTVFETFFKKTKTQLRVQCVS